MTLTRNYVDVEGGVRDWLRACPAIVTLVTNRVFFGIPETTAYPLLVVRQVGGGPELSDTPNTVALIQIDCWGQSAKSKGQAAELKNAVESEIESLKAGTPMGDSAVAIWAHVVNSIWLPDPLSDQARYAITAEIAVHTNTA